MYQPKDEDLRKIRDKISAKNWKRRVGAARKLETTVKAILARIERGRSQDAAIAAQVDPSQRSRMVRALKRYRGDGFDGLIDRRSPRERKVTAEERLIMEALRLADLSISVERIGDVLEQKYGDAPSETTIKRVLVELGLERRVGRPSSSGVKVERLDLAGLELIRAAEAETSAVEDLVTGIVDVAQQLPEPGEVEDSDRENRDKQGHFTGRYNRARRKKGGQAVAEAYRTAEEKAETKDLGRLSFRTQRRETIEAKVWSVMATPVLTIGNRLEELSGPRGRYLEGISGFAYLPATLRKAVAEWTVAGVGDVFQQIHGWTWHRVSVERWERGYRAAVVYVDTFAKPLWSRQFVKAAKVASTGRVQPALVSTFIQTGAGSPIYFETYSGAAPLAPRVLELLEEVERQAEYPIGRLTIIDGEACSARLLRDFKDAERDLVTALSSTQAKPERIRFGKGSAPQPYREGDTLREGMITLTDSKDKSIRVNARAIVIEQRTKEEWSALVTLADKDQWPTRVLADLYFDRWPKQENFFRLANGAVGLKDVNGYGKRLVANITVLTKIDKLKQNAERLDEKVQTAEQECEELAEQTETVNKERRRVDRYVGKRQERTDEALETDQTHTAAFAQAVSELRESSDRLEELDKELKKLARVQQKTTSQKNRSEQRATKLHKELTKLEGRKEILEADVAKDVLFTTLKLTLAMLVQFVVVEYFPHRRMEWVTFLSQLASLPGRRETTDSTVTTFIEANDRNVELMEALEKACRRINARRLMYKDRRLRYVLEWPDPAKSPVR